LEYRHRPKNKEELIKAIKKEIYNRQGDSGNPNWKTDLNCIDVSGVKDFSFLFSDRYGLMNFQGNISEWNVSNAENMSKMFYRSKFDGDISKWNVRNVKDMSGMFKLCSHVPAGIEDWDVSGVEDMSEMFSNAFFYGCTLEKWNVENVKKADEMFKNVRGVHKLGLEGWKFKSLESMKGMFRFSESVYFNPHQADLGEWTKYVPYEVLRFCGYRNYTLPSYESRYLPEEIKTDYGFLATIIEWYRDVGLREGRNDVESAVLRILDEKKFKNKRLLGEFYLATGGRYDYLTEDKEVRRAVAESVKEKIDKTSLRKVYAKYEGEIKRYPSLLLWAVTRFPYRDKLGISGLEKMNDEEAYLLRNYVIVEKLGEIARKKNGIGKKNVQKER